MTSLIVLNRGLHIVDSIALRDVKSDGLARKSVDENLHPTTEAKYQVNSGLLLNVVVTQGSAVCQLRAGENQTLLVLGNTLLVLVSSLHVVVLISFAITTGSMLFVVWLFLKWSSKTGLNLMTMVPLIIREKKI